MRCKSHSPFTAKRSVMRLKSLISIASLIVVFGCSPSSPDAESKSKSIQLNCIACVDGKNVGIEQIDDILAFKFNIVQAKRAVKFPMRKEPDAKARKFFSSQYGKMAKSEAVLEAIVNAAAEKRKIVPTSDDYRRIREQYSVKICGDPTAFNMTTSVVDRIGFLPEFMSRLESDARSLACLRQVNPNLSLDVTERDIDEFLVLVDKENALIAASNAVAYATASNVLEKIKSGEDFGRLADQYSEDPEKDEGGDMGFIYLTGETSYVNYEPAYVQLLLMKTNSVSKIMRTKFGLEIIKVLEESVVEKPDDPITKHVLRICFALSDPKPKQSRKQVAALLKRKRILTLYGQNSYRQLAQDLDVRLQGKRSLDQFFEKVFKSESE